MRVKIELTGALIKLMNRVEREFETAAPDGITLRALMIQLGLKEEHFRYVLGVVNGRTQPGTHVLCNGDTVRLILPLSGG